MRFELEDRSFEALQPQTHGFGVIPDKVADIFNFCFADIYKIMTKGWEIKKIIIRKTEHRIVHNLQTHNYTAFNLSQ